MSSKTKVRGEGKYEGYHYPHIDLKKEDYFEYKAARMTDKDISRRIGTHLNALYEWKDRELTTEERKAKKNNFSTDRDFRQPKKETKRNSPPVTAWKMSEEERLAYIAKHPIVPKKKKEYPAEYFE